MLCPADNFFRAAKKVGIVPWHDEGDSSGDETPDRDSTSKRRKVEIHQAKTVPECVPENTISFDEKSPHAPLPPAWHASLSATLGFSSQRRQQLPAGSCSTARQGLKLDMATFSKKFKHDSCW